MTKRKEREIMQSSRTAELEESAVDANIIRHSGRELCECTKAKYCLPLIVKIMHQCDFITSSLCSPNIGGRRSE